MPADYEEFPRPAENYYESRHELLTQGDICADVPWSQLGPTLVRVDPPPEGLPIPAGHIPVVQYVWTSGYGIVVSDTCDFRHPRADEIAAHPASFDAPDAIYQNGYVRVAPIFPLHDYEAIPAGEQVRERVRQFDHFRRLFYLPEYSADGNLRMSEGVAALHMTDLLHVDLVRRLDRVAQLTFAGRQQFARKLVYFDTGYQLSRANFNPDLW